MDNQPPSPRRRRWRSFSLRASLIVVLAFAFGFAWLAHRARTRRQLIELIRETPGDVMFDYKFSGTQGGLKAGSWAPDWARRSLGDEFFHDVTWVRVEGPRFGDEELAKLRGLNRIEAFAIVQTSVTEAGLARHLRVRTTLMGLFLNGSRITDAGVDALNIGQFDKLTLLDLQRTQVSKAKIAELRRAFPKVEVLSGRVVNRFYPDRMPARS